MNENNRSIGKYGDIFDVSTTEYRQCVYGLRNNICKININVINCDINTELNKIKHIHNIIFIFLSQLILSDYFFSYIKQFLSNQQEKN